jgi:hypothetical protein
MHDAAADRSAKLKPDFVKSLKQCRVPGKPMGRCLARFNTQGNRFERRKLNQTHQDEVSAEYNRVTKRKDPPKRGSPWRISFAFPGKPGLVSQVV